MARPCGPDLPPGFSRRDSDSDSEEDQPQKTGASSIGPMLPPPRKPARRTAGPSPPPSSSSSSIGPMLPPHLQRALAGADGDEEEGKQQQMQGPERHQGDKRERDDDQEIDEYVVGPMPPMPGAGAAEDDSVAAAFEERAERMKRKLTGQDEDVEAQRRAALEAEREWMVMLPEGRRKPTAVTARSFQTTTNHFEMDSSWAETPGQKRTREDKGSVAAVPSSSSSSSSSKRAAKDDTRTAATAIRDQRLAAAVGKHQRGDSLVAIHQARRQESGESSERRPFNRETDMTMKPIDAQRRKDQLTSSARFENRFSRGSFL